MPKATKTNTPKPLLAIIIIAIMSMLLFIFQKQNKQQKTINSNYNFTHQLPLTTITPQAKNNISQNWKTYSDNNYGFTIKYPSDWKAQTGKNSNYPGLVLFIPPNLGTNNEGEISIWPRNIFKTASLNDFMNSTDPETGTVESIVYKIEKNTIISGQEALITRGGSAKNIGRHTLFIKNAILYDIILQSFDFSGKPHLNENIYNDMLNSFLFTK